MERRFDSQMSCYEKVQDSYRHQCRLPQDVHARCRSNIQKVFRAVKEDREQASWLQDKYKDLLHITESIFLLQDMKTWSRVAFIRQNPEEHATHGVFVSASEPNHTVPNAK